MGTPQESPTQMPQDSAVQTWHHCDRALASMQLQMDRLMGKWTPAQSPSVQRRGGHQALLRQKKFPKRKRKRSRASSKRVKRSPLARKRPTIFKGKKRKSVRNYGTSTEQQPCFSRHRRRVVKLLVSRPWNWRIVRQRPLDLLSDACWFQCSN